MVRTAAGLVTLTLALPVAAGCSSAPVVGPDVRVDLAGWSTGGTYTREDRYFTAISFDTFCVEGDDEVTVTDVEFIKSSGMEVVSAGYTDHPPADAAGVGDFAANDITVTPRMPRCDDQTSELVMEIRRTGDGNVWSSGLRVTTAEAGTHEGHATLMYCADPDGCTEEEAYSIPTVDVG